jgi:hypothetical protein
MLLWLLLLVLLIPILSIVLDSQVGKALATRLERRGLGDGDRIAGERIAFLESETERLSSEVERLSEESRFLHQLLAERTPDRNLPPGAEER